MSTTESASPRFAGIEDWGSSDSVLGILEGQFAAIAAVQAAAPALAEAIDRGAERLAKGGRLIYMGAGTSGRIATQDAAELPPTFNWPYERALSLMAGGSTALTLAAEGAEDSEELAQADLDKVQVGPNDVVIGLAASGRTPYAIAGLVHARKAGALTIGIFNNPGGKLGEVADIAVLLETGSEFLAGSDAHEGGHGAEGGAQLHLDRRDDQAGLCLSRHDGGDEAHQCEAGRPRRQDGRGADRGGLRHRAADAGYCRWQHQAGDSDAGKGCRCAGGGQGA
ncbi:N-acetylmuramic acid 6-phosphate etherase [Devosia sp. A8/3-2]|nr:N-acetylmuramic acid 6-phosphate etherase [Devosia sp. A8/3-2]